MTNTTSNLGTRHEFMKTITVLVALAASALLAACDADLTVPDFNNPSLEELRDNPTRNAVTTAARGMLVGGRDEFDDRNGYISLLGIIGRESYNFDNADPRFITEMLEAPQLDPSSPAFGGNLWSERYRNIRTGTLVLNALEQEIPGMTEPEKEAVRGFTKTLQAHELLLVINTRDVNGAVIDFDTDPTGEPAPLAPKGQVFDRIVALLDEARVHLEAGGGVFPFALPSGFAGFDTPPTFVQFNRALKARVDVYMGNWAAALESLGASFLSEEPADLDLGVYHAYGTGSGDDVNELFDPGDAPDILAHPSLADEVELKANGQPDDRFQEKVRTVTSQTLRDITTNLAFTIYDGLSVPVPIIRNEELILLRAEANIHLDNVPDAREDLNLVRVNSGGLAPLGPGWEVAGTTEFFIDEVLRQRRYSLLFEGGHRWIDMRRYGRLDDLPLDLASHRVHAAFPVPEAECLARGEETCSAAS